MKYTHIVFGVTFLLSLFLISINASADTYISFSSNRTGNYDIYIMDTNGGNLRNLTNHPAYDAKATWAPNGRAFAFVSDRDGDSEIYIMNLNGTEPRRLTYRPGPDINPAWSPDGKWIAFSAGIRKEQSYSYDLYKIDIHGENLQQLTDDGKYNLVPSWSPDGEQIAFYSRPKDIGGIYVMNADGKRIRRVMRPQDRGTAPSWSPDGKQIAYYVGIMGSGIYIMGAQGQNPRRVTPNKIWSYSPSWSPDGKWIAYHAEIDNPWGNPNVDVNIYLVSVDGGKPRKITKHVGKDRDPAWVPEGFLSVSPSAEKRTTPWGRLKQSEAASK